MSHTCATCYHVTTRPKPDVCKICQNGSNWVDRDRPTDLPPPKCVAPQYGQDDLVLYVGDNPLLKGKTGIVNEICVSGIDVRFEGGVNHWVMPENIVLKYPVENIGTKQVKSTEHNAVSHPSHYTQGKIECLDAIESAVTGLTGMDAVLTAQVIKYMWRWKMKNGAEDLNKARFYLDRLVAKWEGENNAK